MQHHLPKRRRSESADPQALVPAPSVFELPTQNSLAKGCSPAQCREDSPSDSRCTSGSCSECANPACPFPRVSGRTGKPHAKFFVCDNKSVCEACRGHYRNHGVMRTSFVEVISKYDTKYREDSPSDSRCLSGCCSDCTNTACPFPRGKLFHVRGAYRLKFRNFRGQIVCHQCAVFYGKHGTWRSEAAVSVLIATHSLKQSEWRSQMNKEGGRLKHRSLALEDPAYGHTHSGESASCELTSMLLLLHQKLSCAFDCVVFRKSSSRRSC